MSEASQEPTQSTEERTLFQAHPAMVRARPFLFTLLAIVALATLGGSIVSFAGIWTGIGGIFAIIFLVIAVVAGFILFWWWLQCKRTTLTVTTSRTSMREGLLSKHITEVWHHHVRNVQVTQSFSERIMGVGTISIASAGKSDFEIQMHGVPKVKKIKDLIDQNRTSTQPQPQLD